MPVKFIKLDFATAKIANNKYPSNTHFYNTTVI